MTLAGQRAALDYLTTIYGAINRLPSEDFINFQFKSHANPDIIYTVNVPYVSGRNEKCWESWEANCTRASLVEALPGTPETSLLVSAEQSGHNHNFSPEDVGTTNLAVLKAAMIVRSLLVNELKDTNSVMYDLAWKLRR
ncbi:hypothetical protein BASA83_012016 [Batrachochytrium salamandrivorans]|nr:hypothetical protein BASA83_012016 [Batrachochytrium salamandrivorans]